MHLNKILDQIKHHPSPTEAIDKLGKALEKHEGSLLEKGFQILKSELCANVYEAINGPHFDEEHARYAVEGMENEDGTKGPHWTVEETTSVANQMGINLRSEKHNKWDWYVAMNMIYSDFYKAVVAMVRHTPATASATLPVFVSTTGSVSTASNNNNIPVVKGDSTPLVGSEISAGNRYWVYYNKCDNVIQVMNHYTVAAAPAA